MTDNEADRQAIRDCETLRAKPNNERTVTMFDNIIGKFCVIRTYSAGVHTGVVEAVSADGKIVTLRDARRIWRWKGANTLNEIALRGVHMTEHTRISEPVAHLTLTECIEIIPATDEACTNLEKSRWF